MPRVLLAAQRLDGVPDTVIAALTAEGMEVRTASAERVRTAVPELRPTCVLLCAPASNPAGLQLCRGLRQQSDVPIIVLSCNRCRGDGVTWLQSGADDYITRPLDSKDVVARVRAIARRRQLDLSGAPSVRRLGDMAIEYRHQRVSIGGVHAPLTPTEFRVLTFLAEQPGRIRSRREILEDLGHGMHVGDERACDVHISRLRRKVEDDPACPQRIITVRGVGYALVSVPPNGGRDLHRVDGR